MVILCEDRSRRREFIAKSLTGSVRANNSDAVVTSKQP
jgi:hypothetical protein